MGCCPSDPTCEGEGPEEEGEAESDPTTQRVQTPDRITTVEKPSVEVKVEKSGNRMDGAFVVPAPKLPKKLADLKLDRLKLKSPQPCSKSRIVASPLSDISLREDNEVLSPLKPAIPDPNEQAGHSFFEKSFFKRHGVGMTHATPPRKKCDPGLLESHGFALPDDVEDGGGELIGEGLTDIEVNVDPDSGMSSLTIPPRHPSH
uniref:Uncharacterized protein n=1 Tax=Lotharella globosa TaxID=91324 RepID=A0A7S3Z8D3_9EUKA